MHKSLFQNPTLLHLTLGTMALLDDREGQLAKDILENCSDLMLRFLNDFFRKSPCTTDKCTLANLIMLFLKKPSRLVRHLSGEPSSIRSLWSKVLVAFSTSAFRRKVKQTRTVILCDWVEFLLNYQLPKVLLTSLTECWLLWLEAVKAVLS